VSINASFFFFLALSITIIYFDNQKNALKTARSFISTLIHPVEIIASFPYKIKDSVSALLVSHQTLSSDNEKLIEELLLLRTRLQQYEIIESENRRLRKLLESSFRLKNKILLAQLVAVQLDSFQKKIVIDKGENDLAYEGQPVVDSGGIVGQIIETNPFSSTVLLITDPNHGLPVQIDRNSLRANAIGSGEGDKLILENLPNPLVTDSEVPNCCDIMVGDLVVSSGLARVFPRNFPVGEVEEIKQDISKSTTTIIVKPFAQFANIREVLMVWPNEYKEQ
jgi:rod shape-determining protein MreC|tara:strand:+ start:137 stop:976 length:840 start_codon:yes stop_codon:yes gene_type:complete